MISAGAKLLEKVFQIDISKCKSCGEDMEIISLVEDPMVIQKTLTHCGLAPILLHPLTLLFTKKDSSAKRQVTEV